MMQKYQTIDHIELPGALHSSWQNTLNLLAEILQVPAALIMRVHSKEIEVYVSSQSPGNVYKEGEKADLNTGLYCETVMDSQKELLVPNALTDPAWDHNPDIELGMISYCGFPISWPSGETFGTICILDIKENKYSTLYRKLLEQFRDTVRSGLTEAHDYYLLEKAHNGLLISQKTLKQEIKERKEARAEAERANLSKSEFLANMSHELRTPLNAIIGFSDMLMNETFGQLGNSKNSESVNSIHEAGTHLMEVIGDILDISRIEAGETTVNDEEIDLLKSINDCIAMMRVRAEKAKVSIDIDTPEYLPALHADERHIRQIILNLLSNAVKFTPVGGQVMINARRNEDSCIEIKFMDTGVGIAAGDIHKVLEPFGQVAESLKRSHGGTGLGLPICNSLMELHDGSLGIESEVDSGTTVTIRFPAERTVQSYLM